jgi:hypothetical protein
MGDDVAAKIPPADPKETAVAIKGLPRSATESALMNVVGAHGKMLRVKLDGLGGAHVVFASTRAAQRAAVSLNGAVVDGAKITAQHVRTFAKTTRPCRGFQEGKCRKGDQCKYWHGTETETATPKAALTAPPTVSTAKLKKKNSEATAAVEAIAAPAPATTTPIASAMAGDDISGIPKASICRNFAKGTCAHADKCRYAHVLGAGPLPPPARASIPTQCTFFAAGKCTKGDDCAFLHGAKPSVAAPPTSKLPPRCSFFAAGKCARGSQCGFAHVPPTLAATAAARPKQPVGKPVAAKAVAVKKVKPPAVEAPMSIHGGEEDRTCIECEQPGTATWRCEACENALYCDDCKTLVHRPKVMKAHTQERLPEPTRPPVCGECETQAASVHCEDCGVVYCDECDASVHQFKSLRGHTRSALAKSSSKSAPATEKKVANEKKPKRETVASSVTSYIESVPQYDLPSESESSSEEEEAEEQEIHQQSVPQRAVKQTAAVQESGSESEDEEEESPAAAAMRAATTGYTKSVPKYELSSESESSSEDEAEDDDSVERVEPSIVKVAVVAPKQATATTTKNAASSDSDDDDFEDERPIVTRPVQPTPARPTTRVPSTITISSESESESGSEHGATTKPTAKTVPVKRKASSSDSDSESSDNSDVKRTPPPVKQQPRMAAKTPARPAAAPAAKVGISTGSSHTLVKAIEAYAESDRTDVLHLDPNLNGFERLLAHDCAERLGLDHVSVGEGLDRHITVARKGMGLKRGGAPAAGASSSTGKRQKRA